MPAADLGGLGIGQLRFEGDAGWAWSTPGPTGEGTAAAQTDGVVLRSGDRGRTWREITHSGQDVLALELHTGQLVMVTGACDATTCTDLRVVQATSQATSMRLAVEMPLSGVEVAPGEVSVHFAGSTPFVVTGSAAAGLSIWRIPPGAAEPVRVAPPQDCATLSTFAAAPDADGVLYALCAVSTGAGGADAVQLYGSTTSGASWVPAGSPQPMDPSVGPGLGAGDAAHVVVLGSLGVQVSADGGGSWQVPEQPPLSTMTDAPVQFGEPGAAAVTAAADGTLLVRGAQFEGGQGGFWRSDDDGLTWTRVTVSTSAAP